MTNSPWRPLGELTAGDMWAAVVEHSQVENLDRTHCENRTSIGVLLQPDRNLSQGCFLTDSPRGGHVPLGSVVAIPKGVPLNVRSRRMPRRRMLHCRLPEDAATGANPLPLEPCLDLRNRSLLRSLSRLAAEVISPGFASDLIVEGLGLVIAGELARCVAGTAGGTLRGGLAPWQLRRIDDYVLAGHWNCSVTEIAELCGISAGHAMRAFRQSTGQSLATHVAALRVDRACALLAQDGLSISSIGDELRFASPSAFATAFRRVTGTTPRAFRQQSRALRQ